MQLEHFHQLPLSLGGIRQFAIEPGHLLFALAGPLAAGAVQFLRDFQHHLAREHPRCDRFQQPAVERIRAAPAIAARTGRQPGVAVVVGVARAMAVHRGFDVHARAAVAAGQQTGQQVRRHWRSALAPRRSPLDLLRLIPLFARDDRFEALHLDLTLR
nr:hypothetical protein [Nevskia sp.]